GLSRADGRDLTYFLWSGDVRLALLPWLALGLGDLGLRFGPEAAGGNHVALTATPLVELSRWTGVRYSGTGHQWHLDLGLAAQHVVADQGPRHPFAAEVALGFRFFAADVAEPDLVVGA